MIIKVQINQSVVEYRGSDFQKRTRTPHNCNLVDTHALRVSDRLFVKKKKEDIFRDGL